jgi:hypothetical protein
MQIARGSKLGIPAVCAAVGTSFVIGTESGQFIICSWNGDSPSILEISRKPLQSLSLSPDQETAIVCDSDSSVYFVNLKGLSVTRCPKKSNIVHFVSPEIVLERSGFDVTYRQFPSYNFLESQSLPDHSLFKPPEVRKQEFLTAISTPQSPLEIARLARLSQLTFLAELFESLDDNRFIAGSYGANLCRTAMIRYLEMEALFAGQEQGEEVRERQVRNALLLGKSELAVTLLMSSPPNGEAYVLDMVKAALVDMPGIGNTLLVSATALVSVGKIDDAVDLLMLTKQMKQAAKVLLNNERFQTAFEIVRAVLENEEIDELLDEIEHAILMGGNLRLIGAVMGLKKFELAGELLEALGRNVEAEIIRGLQGSEGLYLVRER